MNSTLQPREPEGPEPQEPVEIVELGNAKALTKGWTNLEECETHPTLATRPPL